MHGRREEQEEYALDHLPLLLVLLQFGDKGGGILEPLLHVLVCLCLLHQVLLYLLLLQGYGKDDDGRCVVGVRAAGMTAVGRGKQS
jgi:hypothetical protein